MKRLNNNGVSLAETLGAITVLGIVLGVALTTVNSRAKQLNIINTEMVTLFELNDDSNRFYINNTEASLPDASPKTLKDKTSKHIVQSGKNLKSNKNIEIDIKNDQRIVDNEEYLLSYVYKDGKWYHLLRQTSGDKRFSGLTDMLFPDNTNTNISEDKIPSKKDETPNKPDGIISENNMPNSHIDKIKININNAITKILKVNEPVDIPTVEEQYNKTIFTDNNNQQIPTSVMINNISPLTLQVKMYSYDNVSNPSNNEGDYKEFHFFAILDLKFSDQSQKQVKVSGKFTANFIEGNKDKNIPNKLVDISAVSELSNNASSYYTSRFWDEKDIEKFKNKNDGNYAINTNQSPIDIKNYSSSANKNLILDVVGGSIVNYIINEINGGNELTNA